MTAGATSSSLAVTADRWLRAIADASSLGLFVYRRGFVYANATFAAYCGLEAEQLVAASRDDLTALAGRCEVVANVLLLVAETASSRLIEVPLAQTGGGPAWVEIALSRLPEEEGAAYLGTVTDTSGRLRGNLGPELEEGWFRALADTTSTAIFVFDDRFLYTNHAFSELSGYSALQLVDLDPLEIVHPDHRPLVGQRRAARRAGEPAPNQYEMMILTRQGEERWIDYSASRIRFNGQLATLGSAIDITDRKAAELALRQSEERLQLAQRAAGVATWDWNLLTDEFIFPSSVIESLGVPVKDVPRTSADFFAAFLFPEDRERVLIAIRRVIHHGEDYAIEHRCLTTTGETRWLSARGRAIRDESGWVVRMVGVSTDITDRKLAELALRESNARLRLMVEQMPAVLWTTDCNLQFTSTLGAGLVALGLRPSDVNGRPVDDFFGGETTGGSVQEAHQRALTGESVSFKMVRRGNVYQAHVEPLRDSDGETTGTIGAALDITERRRAEEALQREREQAQATLASIDDGVIRTNAIGVIEYMNPVAERLLGVQAEAARGTLLDEVFVVVDEVNRKPLLNPVARCLKENRPVMLPGQRILVARDGSELAIRDSAAPIRGPEGEITGAVLAFKDVTAVRNMERAMTHLANHDGLTGLLNRAAFERRLAHALENAAARGTPLSVAQLDLAQLKIINDTCGHLAGDEMIRQAARRLTGFAGERYALARLGAEEFGLLFENTAPPVAREHIERLREVFETFRFVWQEKSFEVRSNIGLVTAAQGDTVSGLMIAIDIACMLAKESGRNRVHEYQSDDETLAERYSEMHWIHRIYKALKEESFRLYCQPIRPLSGEDDEQGLFGEVLIRMVGDDGELVLPRTFVPAAERYRLISSIDRWVVRKSFELLAGEATVGGRPIHRLTINLSGESLNEESFRDYVVEQLEQHRIAPRRVLFEITETAAIANLAGAMRFISELQERGACFVLDDFGSGLSSFAYLKNLPVDYLKIANEFVRGAADSAMHRTLVRSINQIGHELGLKTIAEGVETPEILGLLQEIDLDYVQGYWIAKPEPLLPR